MFGGIIMLSCKNCGAQMSGVDLVCKKCGTPWGKKHKSRKKIYFSILAILLVACAAYVYFTPDIDKAPILEIYNKYFAAKNNNETENNGIIKESSLPSPAVSPEVTSTPEVSESPMVSPSPEVIPVPLPPEFSSVTSSSSLASQGKFSYKPNLTLDGKLETAWLEGAKGNGIGEWILYSSENNQTVSSMTIYNGYLKNNTTYLNNGRMKKFSLEFSDGTILTYDIAKISFSESKKGFEINFDTPVITSSVKLTVLDVYKGAYYSDLAISEISFK